MRFLLVDRITRLEMGASVEGHKCWSLSDDVFRDHFPGNPIVPGVLLVESMAQLVGFLLESTYYAQFGTDKEVAGLLSIIHKAKFRRFVVPGERLDMHGSLLSLDRRRASFRVRASVTNELRAEADLSFVVVSAEPGSMSPELRMHRESYSRFVMGGLGAQ
jgi:3-hydroxyacyl-[acyl-carrier-protein] dehydratase